MKFIIICIILSLTALLTFGQVTLEWVAFYSYGISSSIPKSIVVDGSGNVYVTGQRGGANYDYATLKYSPSGVQQWVQTYNGPGNGDDIAYSIAVDNSGNVYVTGWSFGKGTGYDFATIKYNSSGVQQWVQRYNGPVNNRDGANSIALDGSGNVYITGVCYRSSFGIYDDYTTIKYNSAGDSIWVRRYNGPGNSYDVANSIAVDGSANVYVTGYSAVNSGSNYDYATIKYNSAGDSIWVARYNGPVSGSDYAYSIALDGSGNVYVTGRSSGGVTDYDYATLKYNSSGIQQWAQRYNGLANGCDYANSIAVDGAGNVYVAGVTIATDSDFATIKYNASGVQQWVQRYNGPANDKDYARSLAVDNSGNVYVTGWSYGIGTGYDCTTIKYNSAGSQIWLQRYHANSSDGGNSIKVDTLGKVYVTGISAAQDPLPFYRYATIKYSQIVGIEPINHEIPGKFNLYQNYPNPFNPVTKIRFDLPPYPQGKGLGVSVTVYDILGREITTLVNEQLNPGTYEVEWPACRSCGAERDALKYPNGVYYYKLTAGDYSETKKMVLIK